VLAAEGVTVSAPGYYADENGDVWQGTLDGRYRRWQAHDRVWAPVDEAEFVEVHRTLTPIA
jgi:hypothetical protein